MIKPMYVSETSQCRSRLAPYCVGMGIDIGFGGDPIVPQAITMDLPKPYAETGTHPQNLSGTAMDLRWFNDGVLDFVYSSHLIEDFPYKDQCLLIYEWFRVLAVGGRIVLYCPDEQVYRAHCKASGQPYNEAHKNADYSLLSFHTNVLNKLAKDQDLRFKVLHQNELVEIYSWELVLEKLGNPA